MTELLKCSVDFDDSWEQDVNHWKYNRFFNFIWERPEGNQYSKIWVGYQIGDSAKDLFDKVAESRVVKNGRVRYKYSLNFNEFTNEELRALYIAGNITAIIKVTSDKEYIASNSFSYELDLPPEDLCACEETCSHVEITKFSCKKIRCSWPKAATAPELAELPEGTDPSPVAGYCVELQHKPEEGTEFKPVSGIYLEKRFIEEKQKTEYWIRNSYLTKVEVPEGVDLTLVSDSAASQIFLEGEDNTVVYFNPREFNYDPRDPEDRPNRKDHFKVLVNPYITYSNYYDENGLPQPSARLTSEGTESETFDGTAGIIRISTAEGWKEGHVWILTENGWRESGAVYIKTENGWKRSV